LDHTFESGTGPSVGGAGGLGGLQTWVQPEIDLRTGRIVSARVVSEHRQYRWDPVTAAHTLTAVDHPGSVEEFSRHQWVQALKILSAGDVNVSLPLPSLVVADPRFIAWAERSFRMVRPTRALTLEVTPHPRRPRLTRTHLAPLRRRGVRVAVRLHGRTGFMIPAGGLDATELRLDAALIADASPLADSVIQNAIAHAHRAGALVVAEGVNTASQLHRLQRHRCDHGRGELLGQPEPQRVMARKLSLDDRTTRSRGGIV
jgi:EAL domain-containing protein (putative c-di-GMP-specific phosphodiesterase class I)